MSSLKLMHLVRGLADKTQAGEIDWSADHDEGVYQAAFADFGVKVFERPTRKGGLRGQDYVVAIVNAFGEKIEEVADIDFEEGHFPDAFSVMKELYGAARRKALGVDAAIDKIMGTLGI
jgi:hypothetical protein